MTESAPQAPCPHGPAGQPRLTLRRLGIDTNQDAIVFMRADCPVCRSEGLAALARVLVRLHERTAVATVVHITTDLLAPGEAGLSDALWASLGAAEGDVVRVGHAPPSESLSDVRGKIYGRRLDDGAMRRIVADIAAGFYADVHLASFITACAGSALDREEILALTRAMAGAGECVRWDSRRVADKHCAGGLPGNRTTPVVVAIAAAAGLVIPKTSSRAITSPAGTADTMETLAPVELSMAAVRRVVEREGGCIVWGGAAGLSPVDDILVRVERALDLDSEGQLVASVLSKKIAAGATHVLIDLPVGPSAKIRTAAAAAALAGTLSSVGEACGLCMRVVATNGTQPVGRGIGPALEARDVLSVLQNALEAPASLRERSLFLAGTLLELLDAAASGQGLAEAERLLRSGAAWKKFQAICAAQGGMREPPRAAQTRPVCAPRDGRVAAIDNRRLARVAKLAGAPGAKAAGVDVHAVVGQAVVAGEPLFTIHADTPGEATYALGYVDAHLGIFELEPLP